MPKCGWFGCGITPSYTVYKNKQYYLDSCSDHLHSHVSYLLKWAAQNHVSITLLGVSLDA